MTMPVPITFNLNGEEVTCHTSPRQHCADMLRTACALTGTHVGCEHGVCGACTIRVNGVTVRSCLMFAVQAEGQVIETIEGLSQNAAFDDLREEFLARNAAQCGFCTAGMLVTASELLQQQRPYTRAEIRDFISGNYCRCTGYHAIVDAIEAVNAARLAKTVRRP